MAEGFWDDILKAGSSPLDAGILSYTEKEEGFGCARCVFFAGDRKPCAVVATPVRDTGCCNFWNDDKKAKYRGPKLSAAVAVYIDLSPSGKYTCGECAFIDKSDCGVVGHAVDGEKGSCTAWTLPTEEDKTPVSKPSKGRKDT